MVVPHYNAHDWFIGLGSQSNPQGGQGVPTRTAYVCQLLGREGKLNCVELASAVIVAEWSQDDPNALFYTTVSSATTTTATLDLHRFNVSSTQHGVVRRGCANFEQRARKVLVSDPPQSGDPWLEPNLYVSSDVGTSFQRALFPFSGRTNHFIVAEETEDLVFVAVEHTKTHLEGDTVVKARIGGQPYTFNATRALFSDPIAESAKTYLFFAPLNDPEGCEGIYKGRGKKWSGADEAGDTIVLLQRGTCTFAEKARIAQSQGAKGLIIYNTENTHVLYMQAPKATTEFPVIPTVIVSSDTGELLRGKFGAHKPIELQLVEVNVRETALYVQSNMYVSDPTGVQYSLSLDDVFYNAPRYTGPYGEFVDLYRVESLPGTYLANQLVEDEIITMISHNKGAHWSPISAPEDLDKRHCTATTPCRLDIALQSQHAVYDYPLPLSTASAVGIVIAVGTIPGSNVYYTVISRDGGHTWHQVEGDEAEETDPSWVPTIYDYTILDRGAVLVFVPHAVKTSGIMYALNEGQDGVLRPLTFQQLGVLDSGEEVTVQAIVTEPDAASGVIFLYFYDSSGWQGAKVDYGDGLLQPCQPSDYEWEWPALGGECLLGAKRTFARRRPCAVCSPVKADSALGGKASPCPCTAADFECGPGYRRTNNTKNSQMPCTSDPFVPKYSGPDCQYVRVGGDVCTAGGSQWQGIGTTCSSGDAGGGLSFGTVLLILLLVGLAVLLAVPATRPTVLAAGGAAVDAVRGLVGRVTSAAAPKQASLYNTLRSDNPYGITGGSESDSDVSGDDDDLLAGLDRKDIDGAQEDSQIFGLNEAGGLSISADA